MSVDIPVILSQRPTLSNLGLISNPQEFSARCHELYNKAGLNIPLQYDGITFNLDPIPTQFHPAILKAIDSYERTPHKEPHCMIHLNQGLLAAGENFRIRVAHFDPLVVSYPVNNIHQEAHFIISDALPTIFYDQPFIVPREEFKSQEEAHSSLFEMFTAQAKNECKVLAEPYQMMRFSPYAVHQAQLPMVETDRTMLLIRFY